MGDQIKRTTPMVRLLWIRSRPVAWGRKQLQKAKSNSLPGRNARWSTRQMNIIPLAQNETATG